MPLRSARESSSEYHLIHKRLVGPRTVGRLALHYIELTQSQSIERMYEAGWTAAEAAIISEGEPQQQRLDFLHDAEAAWEYAHELCHERSSEKEHPCHDRMLRIETAAATLPVFKSIIEKKSNAEARKAYHETVLGIATRSANLLEHAVKSRTGHESNYKGLGVEQLAILALSREQTGKLFATPSLARSDSGEHYPRETHDLQVFSFRRGKRQTITPIEVKSSKSPARYSAPVINARQHMDVQNSRDISALIDLYRRDYYHSDSLEPREQQRLNSIRITITDLIQGYHQKRKQSQSPNTPHLRDDTKHPALASQ